LWIIIGWYFTECIVRKFFSLRKKRKWFINHGYNRQKLINLAV
jgi:hypothetical protein